MRSGGFLGCNLHYVRLNQREELAISLLNNSAQGAVAVPRRTLHKYLYTGVRGQPYRIPKSEWSDVAQLPTEKFVDMRGITSSKKSNLQQKLMAKKSKIYEIDGEIYSLEFNSEKKEKLRVFHHFKG